MVYYRSIANIDRNSLAKRPGPVYQRTSVLWNCFCFWNSETVFITLLWDLILKSYIWPRSQHFYVKIAYIPFEVSILNPKIAGMIKIAKTRPKLVAIVLVGCDFNAPQVVNDSKNVKFSAFEVKLLLFILDSKSLFLNQWLFNMKNGNFLGESRTSYKKRHFT